MTRNTRTYSDIDFSFIPHPKTGDISIKTDEDAVKQSIKNLILTRNFERPFRSALGSPIHSLLFEPVTPMLSMLLKRMINDVIDTFEPRAIVLDISIVVDTDSNTINVSIMFKIRNTEKPITIAIILERTR